MIAGSDTTSTVLSGLFCFTIASPECYKTLQKEIDSAFPIGEGDPFDAARLSELPYLNAVLWVLSCQLPFSYNNLSPSNEALRMQPPVPSTLQRAAAEGSGGHWVGSQCVPSSTLPIVTSC